MTDTAPSLRERLEALLTETDPTSTNDASAIFQELRRELELGKIRAADRDSSGRWVANDWVKRGILLGFRLGKLIDQSAGAFPFFDKDTYPVRTFTIDDAVRIVPGGTAIRAGAYVAAGVVCMPPSYVNVGAHVGSGTMIDSHVLVGSCAQIGENVHLSTAVQIGGVLEPVGAVPVIIEDGAFIGGGCGIYEGCVVRTNAVLAPGVILTRATRIYDLVRERTIEQAGDAPLEVPAGAVVVPGSRPASGDYARASGLSLYAPVIVKYRDGGTDASVALEEALR
ncbi:MAG: 2,3,4,5-tetrahydropyridine-2,6-dicarboxylate N-succinyltransferase [Rhodothermales bacterium]